MKGITIRDVDGKSINDAGLLEKLLPLAVGESERSRDKVVRVIEIGIDRNYIIVDVEDV